MVNRHSHQMADLFDNADLTAICYEHNAHAGLTAEGVFLLSAMKTGLLSVGSNRDHIQCAKIPEVKPKSNQ